MSQTPTKTPRLSSKAEPTWEIARLFPLQGTWTLEEYLDLPGNHLIEFCDGFVEVLPMPTELHQQIVAFLYEALLLFIRPANLGKLLFAPLRVRVAPQKMREPDIVFMAVENSARRTNEFWNGADLVVEVVSPDGKERDHETKRIEYAAAGIREYWIVDPQENRITVLRLERSQYAVHGEFMPGQRATSALLAGCSVDVSATFAAGREAL